MMIQQIINKLANQNEHAKLLIFNFHNVVASTDNFGSVDMAVSTFEKQIRWIKKYFEVLPLQQAIHACRQGAIERPTAAITFDDGYETQATIAAPILMKHGLTASFFVTSGHLGESILWNDWFYLFCNCQQITDPSPFYEVLSEQSGHSVEKLKRFSKKELEKCIKYCPLNSREKIITIIRQLLPADISKPRMMTEEQLLSLSEQGFEIGSHTLNHPILAIEEDAVACHEIKQDITNLNEILPRPVTSFAFPNGKPESDYSHVHPLFLARSGITAALTSAVGHFSPGYDPMQVSRVSLYGVSPWGFLRTVISAYRSEVQILSGRGYEKVS